MTDETRTRDDAPAACAGRDDVVLLAYGELPAPGRDRLLAHMEGCAACRGRLADLVAVRAGYESLPGPAALDDSEKARLLASVTGSRSAGSAAGAAGRRSAIPWRPLAAAAVVALAYLAGYATAPTVGGPATAERLAGIEAELAELRRGRLEVAIEHPSAIVRMQEIHAVRAGAPGTVTALLLDVLERDPNPNVRLAALDALRQAELSEAEGQAVLLRLQSEPSPLLRSALIEFVVSRGIEGRRPVLERLERSDDDPAVRAKARIMLERRT